jgi:Protein of unknown function (DUF3015)
MSKKLMGIALAIGLLVVVPLSASAGDKGAGCGLGKTLFGGQSGFLPHTLALTSNDAGTAIDSQSIGITAGTSGCDVSKQVNNESPRDQFVSINLENLSQEMAVGDGEYLHALASLMGCGQDTYADFGQMTREQYPALMAQADVSSDQLVTGLEHEIVTRPELASRCTRVS